MVSTLTDVWRQVRAPVEADRWSGNVPRITGRVLGLFAAVVALWSIAPPVRHLVSVPRRYFDDYYFDAPDTSLSWALVLGLLAAALGRRKRVAWWLLVGYLVVRVLFLAALVVVDGDPHAAVAAVIESGVLLILVAARKQFSTRVRRGALPRAVTVLIVGLGVGTVAGWGLLSVVPGDLAPGERLLWAFNRVSALSLIDLDDFSGHPPAAASAVLGTFGAVALLASMLVLFRAQRSANALTGYDESAIRGLLLHHGDDDSLGYFATRRDKAVVFSPDGRAAITYRVEIGVCVASGDPVGDVQAWPQVIKAWRREIDRYGWTAAVMGASEAGARAYRASGLNVLHLGDEAVLDTREFRLAGADMRQVRQAVNRATRHGVTVRIRRHRDVPASEMGEIIGLAESWRGSATERGFSMALGRLGDPLDGDCVLVEAVRPDGQPIALLSLVPWGSHALSLDVMRRDPEAPNGVVELMIATLAEESPQLGVRRISLNFAVFRAVFHDGARIGAGPVLKAWRRVLQFLSRWWQLETLYRSNEKYCPKWYPRYLCYEVGSALPRVGVASAIAEGFIPVPGSADSSARHTGTQESLSSDFVLRAGLNLDGRPPSWAVQRPQPPRRRMPEQMRVRSAKLESLARSGVDTSPPARRPTHSLRQATVAPLGTEMRLAGRLVRVRHHGGVVFVDLRVWSDQVQIMIDARSVGEERTRALTREFDIGDLAEFEGVLTRTRSGDRALSARDWSLLGKSLHPLPDKWKGLTDPEALVRQRHLDLMLNQRARDVIEARSAIVTALRDLLREDGYLEVETPILQPVHGGANAAPFQTHINAYDLDLYLRIAPELYLKRLCVAGMDQVFEIGRVFRNEGADRTHNPEFTILEAYRAHSDYEEMMTLCRRLIQAAAVAAHGREVIMRRGPDGDLVEVDISGDWPVVSMYQAVSDAVGVHVDPNTPLDTLQRLCNDRDVGYQTTWDAGAVAQALYEELVEKTTEFPTFYTDFPTSTSPLTRPHPTIEGVAAKWDLVAWGVELGTAYSELTDPIEQRRRLTQQSMLAAGGDPDAMELDEAFLTTLEYAMPPTGGLGMGVDRVVMLITGATIRESLAFPLVRPHP
ncbi:bifunctional lysylphosphatidylglycerol synthetase/lysine--tRNA ligase LysX [Gordonia lacunae]|uniref:bifunctional lysylphosphatidylglycerol synthetase/lysine--tRNA ligase LysX n=1 Tax=Gordonia lacunae TaxID=417102 RepID=UPI0039E4A582